VTLQVQLAIYRKINSLAGLAPFEDPLFHNTLQLSVRDSQTRPALTVRMLLSLGSSFVTLAAFMGVLLNLNPLLAALVILVAVPQLLVERKFARQRFRLGTEMSQDERRAIYYGHVLSAPHFIKELRLFNLADYFLKSLHHTQLDLNHRQQRQEIRELRWQLGLALLTNLSAAAAYALVILQAFAGHFSLGDLMLYLSALGSVQQSLSAAAYGLGSMHESALFYSRYADVLALPDPLQSHAPLRPVPPLRSGIELRNVSFRYGVAQPWVLRNVDLVLPAGKCLGLVGLNGEGKTTLVKLITRLYDPTEGQILWDGVDIREFDPSQLRNCIAVMFQDYARYDLTIQENIGLGNLAHINNSKCVREAAIAAGIDHRIETLPRGYETMLSRSFGSDDLGIDLSGGEWQKIALARMFLRDASVLVLDEPTAALDIQSEHELYHHFMSVTSKRTSLLISHRLSTVRMADLIAVLAGGCIIEYGTHEDLLNHGGTYAKLYRMQADRYMSVPGEPRG
jgi:ATP-binding cassette subfamily B protein